MLHFNATQFNSNGVQQFLIQSTMKAYSSMMRHFSDWWLLDSSSRKPKWQRFPVAPGAAAGAQRRGWCPRPHKLLRKKLEVCQRIQSRRCTRDQQSTGWIEKQCKTRLRGDSSPCSPDVEKKTSHWCETAQLARRHSTTHASISLSTRNLCDRSTVAQENLVVLLRINISYRYMVVATLIVLLVDFLFFYNDC